MTSARTTFRKDINGLRTIAVVLVMLYHFNLLGVAGGFVGVDVFFVISGFLMTGIILRGINKSTFSILDFYADRMRRILPALAMLCFLLLGFGWFFLAPSDYALLGKHAASSVSFISNFIYKGEAGYFDAPSQYKWLLHTWSLSVEWQFYLLYPLLFSGLVSVTKSRPKYLRIVLWVLLLLSLDASIWMTPVKDKVSFYLLPARAWEMLAGGLVYLYKPDGIQKPFQKALLEIIGLALIISSSLIFDIDTLWPSYHAALPVLGAVMILLAGRTSFWTGNRLFQWLGNWSYSIYLYHWPVIVALGYLFLSNNAALRWTGLMGSVFLGAASYFLIEQPFRKTWRRGTKATLVYSLTVIAILSALGGLIQSRDGFPSRVSEAVRIADNIMTESGRPETDTGDKDCGFSKRTGKVKPCITGDAKNIRFVIWGDSHAGVVRNALQKALGQKTGMILYTHSCATIFDTELESKRLKNRCKDFNDAVLQQVKKLPHNVNVIIVNRYSANIHGFNEGTKKKTGIIYLDQTETKDPYKLYQMKLADTLCVIAKSHKVYAMRPIPEMGVDVPKYLARQMMLHGKSTDVTVSLQDYKKRNNVALAALNRAAAQCRITLLDPTPQLCKKGQCLGSIDGKPLYFDDDHLNDYGRSRLSPLFKSAFRYK